MENYPAFLQTALDLVNQGVELALGWLLSPVAWSQFGLLIAAFVLAWLVNRKLQGIARRLLTPAPDNTNILASARRFVLQFLPLLLPVLAYGFTAIAEQIVVSIFSSGEVIAFGKRVFLFLAARAFVRDILKDGFLRLLGKYILIPASALYAVGLLPTVTARMQETVVPLGNLSFDLFWLTQFLVLGALVFWFGRWSNEQSSTYITAQDEIEPATRQLAVKAAEIAIFGALFLVLMNVMGISLTSLAVLGGAVGVGLGFGLQKIAANFISGVILLLEGQATVGDYVTLDGGEAGTIVKTTARAMILETFDGRWIVVPNEDFITTRVVNYSDSGSANRYEAAFSVSYDTDINLIPEIVETAVAAHPEVLDTPYPPDCELRGFGDSGVNFAVEFWVNGIDDGAKKYTSDVLFVVWNALRDANIEIPYPQRVVHMKTDTSE